MPKKNEYKRLSKRVQSLLSLSEGLEVEFKEKLGGLETTDIVAFANSENGGAILIGVREISTPNGQQRGEVIGCQIGDNAKLQILNKALSCVPPIQIDIIVENLSENPFYRVEIPSGAAKPYCTSGGTYKIRVDGRVRSLHPEAVLKILLEREATEFRQRFIEATQELEANLKSSLNSVDLIKSTIDEKLEEIGDTLGWAEYRVDDSVSIIERVEWATQSMSKDINALQKRVVALLESSGTKDPVKEEMRKRLMNAMEEQIRDNEKMLAMVKEGKLRSVTLESSLLGYFSEDEANRMFSDVCRKIQKGGG